MSTKYFKHEGPVSMTVGARNEVCNKPPVGQKALVATMHKEIDGQNFHPSIAAKLHKLAKSFDPGQG